MKTVQQDWANKLSRQVVERNSIGMDLVLLPPGEFSMGAPESGAYDSEKPRHRVRITKPMLVASTEVTQAQYQAVMETNPSFFCASGEGKELVDGLDTGSFPVEIVSWFDAVEFCNRLSAKEDLAAHYALENVERREDGSIAKADVSVLGGMGYRLPTEAEWEFACRAGTTTHFHFGDSNNGRDSNVDGTQPWGTTEKGPALQRTAAVASHAPNGFGLYDMHGNVCEWCLDWSDSSVYLRFKDSIATDPVRDESSSGFRVKRGGSWSAFAIDSRSASRDSYTPEYRHATFGLRVVRSL